MFCTSCGEEVEDESKFCKKCGSPLEVFDDGISEDNYDDVNEDTENNNINEPNTSAKSEETVGKQPKSWNTQYKGMSVTENENILDSIIPDKKDSFEEKKDKAMVLFGYATILIQIITFVLSLQMVALLNQDRIMFYNLFCVFLSNYNAYKLVQKEKTYKHALIIFGVSIALFIVLNAAVISYLNR